MLDIRGCTTGKINIWALFSWSMLLFHLSRKPGCPVFSVTGPDVSFRSKCGSHHLEGRKSHLFIFVNQFPTKLHPGRLDGKCSRAAKVTQFAGGANHHRIHHELIPLGFAFHVLTQPVPFSPGRLALPASAIELITLIQTVATLGAGISIPGNIRGNPSYRLIRVLTNFGDNDVSHGSYQGLKNLSQTQQLADYLSTKNLVRIQCLSGIDMFLERLESL